MVEDRARAWIQADREGDAAGPRIIHLADRRIVVLPPPGSVAAQWGTQLTGLRGLLRPYPKGVPASGTRLLGEADAAPVARAAP